MLTLALQVLRPALVFSHAAIQRCAGVSKTLKSGRLAVQAQIQTLECFVSGKFNVLVATSVAEEGLDLPACQLVVRRYL